MGPQNTHEKKFSIHETYMRENLGPTKYSREKIWTHEITTTNNFKLTESQWHDGTRPTRTTMVRDPRNLAHSKLKYETLRISATSHRL